MSVPQSVGQRASAEGHRRSGRHRPVIAIVGRPNVGKSTLFNRLVGQRKAIVEDIPGTTRDRLFADVTWEGRELTLVDTGGLLPDTVEGIERLVREQVAVAIAEADLVLFLVDAQAGITPADAAVADELRRSGKPVLLVVNKADNPRREREATEFYQLGLGEPVPVSAYHGIGVYDMMERALALLPPSVASEPEPEGATELALAIVGRPNVGKSLLLNAILGEERSIVSEVPGTTRDAVDTVVVFRGRQLLLIDTAGIRRRGRIEPGIERFSVLRARRAIERADVVAVVLDMGEGVTAQDTHIAGYAWEAGKGVVLVANKGDLLPPEVRRSAAWRGPIEERFYFLGGAPVVLTSALQGWGLSELLEAAMVVGEAHAQRIPTSALNRALREAIAAVSPPSGRGRRPWRLYYATQVSTKPPTFVFFVNYLEELPASYQRYLENHLRRSFGLAGVPIRIQYRSHAPKDAS